MLPDVATSLPGVPAEASASLILAGEGRPTERRWAEPRHSAEMGLDRVDYRIVQFTFVFS